MEPNDSTACADHSGSVAGQRSGVAVRKYWIGGLRADIIEAQRPGGLVEMIIEGCGELAVDS